MVFDLGNKETLNSFSYKAFKIFGLVTLRTNELPPKAGLGIVDHAVPSVLEYTWTCLNDSVLIGCNVELFPHTCEIAGFRSSWCQLSHKCVTVRARVRGIVGASHFSD